MPAGYYRASRLRQRARTLPVVGRQGKRDSHAMCGEKRRVPGQLHSDRRHDCEGHERPRVDDLRRRVDD